MYFLKIIFFLFKSFSVVDFLKKKYHSIFNLLRIDLCGFSILDAFNQIAQDKGLQKFHHFTFDLFGIEL